MSLFSDAPFSKLTIYRRDYVPKLCPRQPLSKGPEPDYANPIAGPMEEHILPRFKYQRLPCTQTKYPEPQAYAEEIIEKYPFSRKFFKEPQGGPLDLNTIDGLYADDNRTVYMVSYCQREDYDSNVARSRKNIALPKDWTPPLTTYRSSYRSPESLMIKKVPVVITIPKDNLKYCGMSTGKTIYESDISDTGNEIITGKLHGDVNIRPTFDQEDLLKAKLIRKN